MNIFFFPFSVLSQILLCLFNKVKEKNPTLEMPLKLFSIAGLSTAQNLIP